MNVPQSAAHKSKLNQQNSNNNIGLPYYFNLYDFNNMKTNVFLRERSNPTPNPNCQWGVQIIQIQII